MSEEAEQGKTESRPKIKLRKPIVPAAREAEFNALVSRWRSETRILSSIQSKVLNKNYQRIMTMGEEILPLIFRDLMSNGGHWYWALECITGDNPASNARDIAEAKQAWLDYAAQHGYLNANERRN